MGNDLSYRGTSDLASPALKKVPTRPIYTRAGDHGRTSLMSGRQVSKADERMHAIGEVDELCAHVAHLADLARGAAPDAAPDASADDLAGIQTSLFFIGAALALEPGQEPAAFGVQIVQQADIEALEHRIDEMTAVLPPLRNFIGQSGLEAASFAHVTRTVCRRAERALVRLDEAASVPEPALAYINRFSDYLFTLARYLMHVNGVAEVIIKAQGSTGS